MHEAVADQIMTATLDAVAAVSDEAIAYTPWSQVNEINNDVTHDSSYRNSAAVYVEAGHIVEEALEKLSYRKYPHGSYTRPGKNINSLR